MHVVVAFASDASEAARHVVGDLALPRLGRLLGTFAEVARDDAEPTTFSPPHERAFARALGWPGEDGALPFAARLAGTARRGGGVTTLGAVGAAAFATDRAGTALRDDDAWALLTPTHWQVGRDDASVLDPALLELDDDESRALCGAVADLLAGDGVRVEWAGADRWLAAHDDFDGWATPSLDRVVGRGVAPWLDETRRRERSDRQRRIGALVRRVQSEAQLAFHVHEVNEAREARGALAVNSFWISGCGRLDPVAAEPALRLDARLRAPLLAGDWVAWADAWRALDASVVAELVDRAGDGLLAALTLCGERAAARFEPRRRSLWQRLRGGGESDVARLLRGLS